ncbi:RagB/SusD family nutrient uptake outer membrane protein [Chondrinema litorale]|uniref:RagB/SusD family nutrient uptake outer membrane protein n=1 Tax=Chondrinema litorale TaxID=2994555 RepID=UPI0025427FAF|nr:RagB/SusD family nutrient uptake outer membrane protein [Chondrinema litorale]UZR98819.1 RagB/SusD family nutrient uptake outer membrane protein [Chondrinema litorale]
MNALKYIFLLVIGLSFASCDDFLDEEPQSNLVDDAVFSNTTNVEAAVNGAYRSLVSQGYYARNLTLATSLSAQELADPNNTNTTYIEFSNHILQPSNSIIQVIWADIYFGIQAANKIIAYAPDADGEQATIDRQLAEAHFLRGLHYFNLVRLFGNVPLYLEPIVNTNSEEIHLPNSSSLEVYDQIITDLEMAENMMPEDFTKEGRASIWAVKAILAKVYLYTEDYEQAAQRASEVINSGSFTLSEEYAPLFVNAGEMETILEIQFNERTGYNGIRVATMPLGDPYNGQGIPLVSEFESVGDSMVYPLFSFYPEGDLRKDDMFYFQDDNYYVIKYTTNPNYDNVSLIRLPEVMLIYAEAQARTSGSVTETAFDAFNTVRIRANVADSIENYTSLDTFIDEVVEEKRRELLLENESWFDYIRAGKAAEFGVTDPNYYLYPIPQAERDVNPNLDQNEGY